MNHLQLLEQKSEKIAVLTELYELGTIAFKIKNEEMQLVLTERISSLKGEIAELDKKISEKQLAATVAA